MLAQHRTGVTLSIGDVFENTPHHPAPCPDCGTEGQPRAWYPMRDGSGNVRLQCPLGHKWAEVQR